MRTRMGGSQKLLEVKGDNLPSSVTSSVNRSRRTIARAVVPTLSDSVSQEILGDVWGHFLTVITRKKCLWHLVGRDQEC